MTAAGALHRLARSRRWALLSVLALALARGSLYAGLMPPWGLIDEEQHVHYIQHLAERRAAPIVGRTYLSPEIANSVRESRRWETFHWVAPGSPDPRDWGLEGHSYEGYQPPLFYALLAPFYLFLPAAVLVKAFALRWAVVALSLLTVWMLYRVTAELFPQRRWLPLLAALFLVCIPERTASVSRVNNDALLEVAATALAWLCARAILNGLTPRRSVLLGLAFALGVWAKMSMAVLAVMFPVVFWQSRAVSKAWVGALLTGGIAAGLIAPLVWRNLWLYGDVTGFAGFAHLVEWPTRPLTVRGGLAAFLDLWQHTWVIWWRSAEVGSSPVLSALYIAMGGLSVLSLVGALQHLWPHVNRAAWPPVITVLGMYLLAIGAWVALALAVYFANQVPVIQGRLFLPAMPLISLLFVWGLGNGWRPKVTVPLALGTLLSLDAASLFGNLLPYFYFWSAFVKNGAAQPYSPLGWQDAWALFYTRLLSDKPPGLQPLLGWLAPIYFAALGLVAYTLWAGWRDTANHRALGRTGQSP